MPYIKEISHLCQTCKRTATHEVFNNHNSSAGYFCRACGHRKMTALIREESGESIRVRQHSEA